MLKRIMKSFLGRMSLAVIIVIGVYLTLFAPESVADTLRSNAEWVLLRFGLGIVAVTLWVLGFLILLVRWPRTLLRRWRIAIGSAGLVFAAHGFLSYFEGYLPLIGYYQLGGSIGREIQGGTPFLDLLRVAVLAGLSIWIFLPHALANSVLARILRGLRVLLKMVFLILRWVFKSLISISITGRRRNPNNRNASIQAQEKVVVSRTPNSEEPPRLPLPLPEESIPISKPVPSLAGGNPSDELPVTSKLESPGSAPQKNYVIGKDWDMPPMSLMNASEVEVEIGEDHLATAQLIEETLAQHQVEVEVAEIKPGPTVTQFGLVPGWVRKGKLSRAGAASKEFEKEGDEETPIFRSRVKVDSVLARERDLALALAAPSLRLQAPVPGEAIIGVEVPNKHPYTVPIRSVMESEPYRQIQEREGLSVALGQASAGESVAIDLINMPHLLIAGATGSGKSVCLNSIIASLVMHQNPSKVRLLLVDPKRVELTPYNGVPHLATQVAVDPEKVVRLLKGAIQEMLRRFKLLEEAGVRNIQSYNHSAKAREPIPYLVICIDELADLMMAASFDVEQSICRLAQMGRATGIHLVVATQRPSVDVVTGLIKANFPTRISFSVASQVDSRTILDMAGAERLLGRGDMLFLSRESAKPRRVQGVFISEEETERLAEYWRGSPGDYLPEVPLEVMGQAAENMAAESQWSEHDDDQDSLYHRALDLANRYRQISTSLLQRRLRIGYPRAARLMDLLEDEGIIASSSEPGKAREVLTLPPESPL